MIIIEIVLEILQNWHFDAYTFLHLICLIPNENTFNDLDSYWQQIKNVGEINRIIEQLLFRDLIRKKSNKELTKEGEQEEDLYHVPTYIRYYFEKKMPLDEKKKAKIDQMIMKNDYYKTRFFYCTY
jgi:hypothetical protein